MRVVLALALFVTLAFGVTTSPLYGDYTTGQFICLAGGAVIRECPSTNCATSLWQQGAVSGEYRGFEILAFQNGYFKIQEPRHGKREGWVSTSVVRPCRFSWAEPQAVPANFAMAKQGCLTAPNVFTLQALFGTPCASRYVAGQAVSGCDPLSNDNLRAHVQTKDVGSFHKVTMHRLAMAGFERAYNKLTSAFPSLVGDSSVLESAGGLCCQGPSSVRSYGVSIDVWVNGLLDPADADAYRVLIAFAQFMAEENFYWYAGTSGTGQLAYRFALAEEEVSKWSVEDQVGIVLDEDLNTADYTDAQAATQVIVNKHPNKSYLVAGRDNSDVIIYRSYDAAQFMRFVYGLAEIGGANRNCEQALAIQDFIGKNSDVYMFVDTDTSASLVCQYVATQARPRGNRYNIVAQANINTVYRDLGYNTGGTIVPFRASQNAITTIVSSIVNFEDKRGYLVAAKTGRETVSSPLFNTHTINVEAGTENTWVLYGSNENDANCYSFDFIVGASGRTSCGGVAAGGDGGVQSFGLPDPQGNVPTCPTIITNTTWNNGGFFQLRWPQPGTYTFRVQLNCGGIGTDQDYWLEYYNQSPIKLVKAAIGNAWRSCDEALPAAQIAPTPFVGSPIAGRELGFVMQLDGISTISNNDPVEVFLVDVTLQTKTPVVVIKEGSNIWKGKFPCPSSPFRLWIQGRDTSGFFWSRQSSVRYIPVNGEITLVGNGTKPFTRTQTTSYAFDLTYTGVSGSGSFVYSQVALRDYKDNLGALSSTGNVVGGAAVTPGEVARLNAAFTTNTDPAAGSLIDFIFSSSSTFTMAPVRIFDNIDDCPGAAICSNFGFCNRGPTGSYCNCTVQTNGVPYPEGTTLRSGPDCSEQVVDQSATQPINGAWGFRPPVGGIWQLTHTADDGCRTQVTAYNVTAWCNEPPVGAARMVGNTTRISGSYTELSTAESTDPDDNALVYVYEWLTTPTGSLVETNGWQTNFPPFQDVSGNKTKTVVSFLADRAGAYSVRVNISDGCNVVSQTVSFSVVCSCPPLVEIDRVVGSYLFPGFGGGNVNLRGTARDTDDFDQNGGNGQQLGLRWDLERYTLRNSGIVYNPVRMVWGTVQVVRTTGNWNSVNNVYQCQFVPADKTYYPGPTTTTRVNSTRTDFIPSRFQFFWPSTVAGPIANLANPDNSVGYFYTESRTVFNENVTTSSSVSALIDTQLGTNVNLNNRFNTNANTLQATWNPQGFFDSATGFLCRGDYTWAFRAADECSNSTQAVTSTVDCDQRPVAIAACSREVKFDAALNRFPQVQLDGRQTFDPEGAALTYTWSEVSKPANSTTTTLLQNTNLVTSRLNPDVFGAYTVQLRAQDNAGCPASTDQVTINAVCLKPDLQSGSISMTNTNGSPINPTFNVTTGNWGDVVLTLNNAVCPDWTVPNRCSTTWRLLRIAENTTRNCDAILNQGTECRINGLDQATGGWQFFATTADNCQNPVTANTNVVSTNCPTSIPGISAVISNPTPTTTYTPTGAVSANALPAPILLNGTLSTPAPAAGVTYLWNITSRPAGSQVTIANPSASATALRVDFAGSYTVSLTVRQGACGSATTSSTYIVNCGAVPAAPTILISNNAPRWNISDPSSRVVNLRASTATLNGCPGCPLASRESCCTYQWQVTSFPADSALSTNPTQGFGNALNVVNQTFTPDIEGTYSYRLDVRAPFRGCANGGVFVTGAVASATVSCLGDFTLQALDPNGQPAGTNAAINSKWRGCVTPECAVSNPEQGTFFTRFGADVTLTGYSAPGFPSNTAVNEVIQYRWFARRIPDNSPGFGNATHPGTGLVNCTWDQNAFSAAAGDGLWANYSCVDNFGTRTFLQGGTLFFANRTSPSQTFNPDWWSGPTPFNDAWQFEVQARGVCQAYTGHTATVTITAECPTITQGAVSVNPATIVFSEQTGRFPRTEFSTAAPTWNYDDSTGASWSNNGLIGIGLDNPLLSWQWFVNGTSANSAIVGSGWAFNTYSVAEATTGVSSDGNVTTNTTSTITRSWSWSNYTETQLEPRPKRTCFFPDVEGLYSFEARLTDSCPGRPVVRVPFSVQANNCTSTPPVAQITVCPGSPATSTAPGCAAIGTDLPYTIDPTTFGRVSFFGTVPANTGQTPKYTWSLIARPNNSKAALNVANFGPSNTQSYTVSSILPDRPGTYTMQLAITDVCGRTSTTSQSVTATCATVLLPTPDPATLARTEVQILNRLFPRVQLKTTDRANCIVATETWAAAFKGTAFMGTRPSVLPNQVIPAPATPPAPGPGDSASIRSVPSLFLMAVAMLAFFLF